MTAAPNNRDALAPRARAAGAHDVLSPRSRTISSDPDRPAGRSGADKGPPRINWTVELLRIFLGLLGLLLALTTVGACLGLAFVSGKMLDVLNDISQRDYSTATQRFEAYAARFSSMQAAGCKVEHKEPQTLKGVITHLWIVQPPGSDDRVVYRWKHVLQTNTVEPMTNPALLLDIAMAYEKASDGAGISFYNPNDTLAQALARGQYDMIGPEQLSRHGGGSGLSAGPVLPPVIAPDKARSRVRSAPAEEPEQPADETQQDQAGDATDVGTGSEQGGGGDAGHDKEKDKDPPPPDNDAVPVE
jgi:hypothetical protein